jgi:hypothetical protein
VQQCVYQITIPRMGNAFDPMKLFGNYKERVKKAWRL